MAGGLFLRLPFTFFFFAEKKSIFRVFSKNDWRHFQKSSMPFENIWDLGAYFSNRVGLSYDVILRLFKVNIDFAQIVRRFYKK